MITIYAFALGIFVFVISVLFLGKTLRANPSLESAQRLSRIGHFLFFVCLCGPFSLTFIHPGVSHLDPLIGLEPMGRYTGVKVLAGFLLVIGTYLMAASGLLLRSRGKGANAFILTKEVVDSSVYRFSRNPMSLGFYLLLLGSALATFSSSLFLAVTAGIIPAHILFLKFLEEKELELRFGERYAAYKRLAPFLF